jgi:hypothetical protein
MRVPSDVVIFESSPFLIHVLHTGMQEMLCGNGVNGTELKVVANSYNLPFLPCFKLFIRTRRVPLLNSADISSFTVGSNETEKKRKMRLSIQVA